MSGWCFCKNIWRYYVREEVCPVCGAPLQPSNFGSSDIDPVTQKVLPKKLPIFRGVRR